MSADATTDAGLLAELRRLQQEGRVALELDHRRLLHIDSPVAIEAEANRWIYAGIIGAGAAWWILGAWIGVAVAGLALVAYLTLGKADLRRRTRRRVEERALQDVALWRKLWGFGGVALVDGGRRCVAPAGNWMQLVRDLSGRGDPP